MEKIVSILIILWITNKKLFLKEIFFALYFFVLQNIYYILHIIVYVEEKFT